jgi:hypothetical protein
MNLNQYEFLRRVGVPLIMLMTLFWLFLRQPIKAHPQSGFSFVLGTVRDASGSVAPNATVGRSASGRAAEFGGSLTGQAVALPEPVGIGIERRAEDGRLSLSKISANRCARRGWLWQRAASRAESHR